MPTYKLNIEYNGKDWYGWQIQPHHPTIQNEIEKALRTALRREIGIVGSGRTDAGVHAGGQVAHFRSEKPVDAYRLTAQINGILPPTIVVPSIAEVPDSFHARFSALWRLYRYRIATRHVALERHIRWHVKPAPDIDLMNEAASVLRGTHEFSAFCRAAAETNNRTCDVTRAEWITDSRHGDASFYIMSDRFLHGMVRAIVGTLIQIGQGMRDPGEMSEILRSRDRTRAGYGAPAHGLTLVQVGYPEQEMI